MVFHWPQIVLLVFIFGITWIDVFMQKRSGRYAMFVFAYDAFLFWLLYEGGFFLGVRP